MIYDEPIKTGAHRLNELNILYQLSQGCTENNNLHQGPCDTLMYTKLRSFNLHVTKRTDNYAPGDWMNQSALAPYQNAPALDERSLCFNLTQDDKKRWSNQKHEHVQRNNDQVQHNTVNTTDGDQVSTRRAKRRQGYSNSTDRRNDVNGSYNTVFTARQSKSHSCAYFTSLVQQTAKAAKRLEFASHMLSCPLSLKKFNHPSIVKCWIHRWFQEMIKRQSFPPSDEWLILGRWTIPSPTPNPLKKKIRSGCFKTSLFAVIIVTVVLLDSSAALSVRLLLPPSPPPSQCPFGFPLPSPTASDSWIWTRPAARGCRGWSHWGSGLPPELPRSWSWWRSRSPCTCPKCSRGWPWHFAPPQKGRRAARERSPRCPGPGCRRRCTSRCCWGRWERWQRCWRLRRPPWSASGAEWRWAECLVPGASTWGPKMHNYKHDVSAEERLTTYPHTILKPTTLKK